jgi:hypothetical protein
VGGVELQDLLGPFQVYIFSTDESYPCFPQAHFVLWLLLLEGRKREVGVRRGVHLWSQKICKGSFIPISEDPTKMFKCVLWMFP